MKNSLLRRSLLVVLLAGISVSVIGCGSRVSGKYVADGGGMTVEFKSGKAILTSGSGQSETDDFTVDGDTVTIKSSAAGDMKFTIMQDGSLSGMLGTLRKAAN
jgi:hypothetical protein